jgi:hypothetical protein
MRPTRIRGKSLVQNLPAGVKRKENEMKLNKIGLCGAMLIVLLCSSCASRLGAFTVISTKSIDWSRAAEFQRKPGRIEGADRMHIILCFPTTGQITIEDAVDDALKQVPGAIALIDAVVRVQNISFVLYSQSAYIVEGSVLIDPKLVSPESGQRGQGSNYLSLSTKDGKNWAKTELSEEEYHSYLSMR